jgi:hypothetical protein
MITLLKKGTCLISYKKANKEIRKARGTLKASDIPETIAGKPGGENKQAITYWDLDKRNWRTFNVDKVTKDIKLEDA